MNRQFDIAIIGGGMVGLASAWKLSRRFPSLKMVVFEKESGLSKHQTGRNSGVIHSGIYYKPGSFKSQNCVEGRRELVAFSKEHKIAHDICGKLIVATNSSELPFLEKIYNHGTQNGIENMEKISSDTIREIEPYCTGIAGIRVGCTGIIDFPGVVHKMAELFLAINPENEIHTGEEVLGTEKKGEFSIVRTQKADYQAKEEESRFHQSEFAKYKEQYDERLVTRLTD
jgi:L-2-hydroxyglutarate oxidase